MERNPQSGQRTKWQPASVGRNRGRRRRIVIGIHVEENATLVYASILSIHENAGMPVELMILADCNDEDRYTLNAIHRIEIIRIGNGGAAAAFNRLVEAVQADIYVFLENGVLLGPDCLCRMVDALDADVTHGLAGPSTNRCWNEQQVIACRGPDAGSIDLATAEVAQRVEGWRTLTPLHSLSDFCYAVTSEVVDAVGLADSGYGTGPCWEMDYNIRAARAGFKGIWVGAAFAYRSPPGARRIANEEKWLEASKQRYQDKFCALREKPGRDYSPHCHGDSCSHFAQMDKIMIRLPLEHQHDGLLPATPTTLDSSVPLVSCIMPTRGRADFVAQAIHYFERQDYPRKELIIAYETAADLPETTDDPRIKHIHTPIHSSIGEKRNAAIRHARGTIIAQWDDDDWYAPTRLSAQIEPILQNVADITGLKDTLFMNIREETCWRASRALFRLMFAENVCGGTLVFRRNVWESVGHYPATSLREDADLMLAGMRKGARLCRVAGQVLFVYIRHAANTWKFDSDRRFPESDREWIPMPDFLHADHDFYAAQSDRAMAVATPRHVPPATPLVSCIMPTSAARKDFLPQAIAHFLAQRYVNKELIVIDDGCEPVSNLIPMNDAIRYYHLSAATSIGAKRNLACEMAQGSIIAHWDDDDWMSPDWLGAQVGTLLRKNADVCGLNKVFFYDPATRQAWQYIYDGQRPWLCGGTLCYTKTFWERNRFPDTSVGEDNAFIWSNQGKNIAINDNGNLFVATIHPGNTSPKRTRDRRWHAYPANELERILSNIA